MQMAASCWNLSSYAPCTLYVVPYVGRRRPSAAKLSSGDRHGLCSHPLCTSAAVQRTEHFARLPVLSETRSHAVSHLVELFALHVSGVRRWVRETRTYNFSCDVQTSRLTLEVAASTARPS